MKKTLLKHSLNIGLVTCISIQSASALTVINDERRWNHQGYDQIWVEFWTPKSSADINKPSSCQHNQDLQLIKVETLERYQAISTGAYAKGPEQRLCIVLRHLRGKNYKEDHWYDTNPIVDVPGCVIQVMEIFNSGGEGNNHTKIKATPACQFKGKCPDDDNLDSAAGWDYNADTKDCCPTNYWDGNKCQNYPVKNVALPDQNRTGPY